MSAPRGGAGPAHFSGRPQHRHAGGGAEGLPPAPLRRVRWRRLFGPRTGCSSGRSFRTASVRGSGCGRRSRLRVDRDTPAQADSLRRPAGGLQTGVFFFREISYPRLKPPMARRRLEPADRRRRYRREKKGKKGKKGKGGKRGMMGDFGGILGDFLWGSSW
jgi:hypothetical protein